MIHTRQVSLEVSDESGVELSLLHCCVRKFCWIERDVWKDFTEWNFTMSTWSCVALLSCSRPACPLVSGWWRCSFGPSCEVLPDTVGRFSPKTGESQLSYLLPPQFLSSVQLPAHTLYLCREIIYTLSVPVSFKLMQNTHFLMLEQFKAAAIL